MTIKYFADFFLHTFHNIQTVAVECADEWFQHILMKSWCNQFSMWSPMFSAAYQQSIAQPWFEEAIFIWFINMHRTAQNNFNIFWMCQEDDQFWSNPNTSEICVNFTQFESQLQNFFIQKYLKETNHKHKTQKLWHYNFTKKEKDWFRLKLFYRCEFYSKHNGHFQ